MSEPFFTVRLDDDGIRMLDQRLLPGREEYLLLRRAEEVAEAIEGMAVRGAPAIGVAAAMGVAVELCATPDAEPERVLEAACTRLAATRPTAVNLDWALAKIRDRIEGLIASGASGEAICREARDFARALHDQDIEVCRAIGEQGRALVPDRARLLTHCNAGGLATAGYGTALGVVRSAAREGKIAQVLASETRPFLQGARLTTWELQRDGIPVTLITDSMAGSLMRAAEIDVVVVGADRIAANGDVANKIGTYPLAVLAQAHGIPFYVAAPLSTIDLETPGGDAIPIEQRSPEEVIRFAGQPIVAPGVTALHPAFDVTPAEHVTAIITESGVIEAPFTDSLARHKSS